ncbi:hypothetical protein UlMin_045317 [Ulmus minor]
MATNCLCFWGLFLLLSLFVHHSFSTPQVHIVYLGRKHISHDPKLTSNHHVQLLSTVFASDEDAKQSVLYSYKHSFSGFSAMLNSSQAAALAKSKDVISVFKSKMMNIQTTRSWDFLGLTLGNSYEATPVQLAYGDNIIVGVIDTGIWPDLESFKEYPGIKPIPYTWRGECEEGDMFPENTCNRKLIGARYYFQGYEKDNRTLNESEYKSARDFLGHGTHTASTAVGSIVKGANLFGLAKGVARGGAPRARLAVYKACWGTENYMTICSEADILAAFDDALHDGVHVISASIGPNSLPLPEFFNSSMSIGSFHAMQVGVSVVVPAGNTGPLGPLPSLVVNVEPWAFTVAASSIDRVFPTRIVVAGNFSVVGESFVTSPISAKLVDPRRFFMDGVCSVNLRKNNNKTAEGLIMLCFSTVGGINKEDAQNAAFNVSASGLIFVDPTVMLEAIDLVPTVYLNIQQGTLLKHYFSRFRRLPMVQIKPTKTVIGKSVAPTVAYFSSRGPNSISPDILKPDISAPGVSILAAWPTKTPLYPDKNDKRLGQRWNFQSGTSMSCPHVAGIVALLKSAHPHWSPAAIRSALMTTAYTRDISLDNILSGGSIKDSDPFDIGSGHVNPLKAMDPGLVYDMKPSDYILYLCNIGYTREEIEMLVLPCPGTDTTTCPKEKKSISNLNYPSISISDLRSTTTIKRTVRNVSQRKNAIYFSYIVKPNGVDVVIWPRVLFFSWFKEEITYYVTFIPQKKSKGRYDFGEIVWSDGFHKVRSPLVVSVNTIATSFVDDDDDHLSGSTSPI